MTPNLLAGSGFHISLAIGQHLWTDLFSEALPAQVAGGQYDVNEQLRPMIALLGNQVNDQMRLLAARTPPLLAPPVEQLRSRFGDRVKKGLSRIRHAASDSVHVNGTWHLNITREGSRFSYSPQSVSVSARVRAVATGTIDVAHGRLKIPFRVERYLRAAFTLGDIHFDRQKGGLVGRVRDMHVELGDHPLVKTAEVWLDRVIDQRMSRFKDVTLLKVGQINQSLEQALGQLKFMAAIENVGVEINDSNLVLQVNFAFKQKEQLAM